MKKLNFNTLLIIIALVLNVNSIFAQTHVDFKNDTTYFICNYGISPKLKMVSVQRMYGNAKIDAVGYFADSTINFDKTTLIILGKEVLFKEYFPLGVDFKTLKYIGVKDNETLYKDDNYIYLYRPYTDRKADIKVSISGYTCINNYIYEDKSGALYFLNAYTGNGKLELTKVTDLPNLDKTTLKHLQGQYYADKNGLYAFGTHYLGSQSDYKNFSQQVKCIMVESADGKNIEPIVTRNYIVYNKSVYARNYSIEKLKLDVDKMIEFNWSYSQRIYFLTDGTNLYENRNSSYYERDWNKDNSYANDFFKSGINILKIYPYEVAFVQNKDLKTLYFENTVRNKDGFKNKKGILVKTNMGYYFANFGRTNVKPQKIENIIIYNNKLKENEPFDESQFLSLGEKKYAYKGLIFFDDIPLKEINDPHHFKLLTSNGIKTNFVTNDDMLIAYGNSYGYQLDISDGATRIIFEKMIKRGVDVTKLKVINENLLVDDDNFYDCSEGKLNIIPIKKLGLNVKLVLGEQ